MRTDRALKWSALVLVLLLLLGGQAAMVRAEEVTVVQYPDSNYEPGPGWPEGWTPPAAPEEIATHMRERVEGIMQRYPQFTRSERRVLDPLPRWTQEYPYFWMQEIVPCGDALYVYMYPEVDDAALYQITDRSYASGKLISGICIFEPVRRITMALEPTPEEYAAEAMVMEFESLVAKSHPGLWWNHGFLDNGSPDFIYVYFNDGEASAKFDVPAYLDPAVSRVRVPIRFVSEMMGAQVGWDETNQQVTIHFPAVTRKLTRAVPVEGYGYADLFDSEKYYPNGARFRLEEQTVSLPAKTIILTIDQPKAMVDGKEVALDAPPVTKQGRTMVPIRFVAEQMGAKVYWVGAEPIFRQEDGKSLGGTYHVHIYTPFFPLFEYPSWYMENWAVKF